MAALIRQCRRKMMLCIRHVVSVTFTPIALKTLIVLSDRCKFLKMLRVTNSVAEIYAG